MSKSICPNCKVTLGCSCQKKTASDGKVVCQSCIVKYEAAIKSHVMHPKPPQNTAPTITSVLYTPPKT